jgi:hypothetical protein
MAQVYNDNFYIIYRSGTKWLPYNENDTLKLYDDKQDALDKAITLFAPQNFKVLQDMSITADIEFED